MSITKEQALGLHGALESNEIVQVSFEKADGTIRDMVCVLNPGVSGDKYESKSDGKSRTPRTPDPDNQLVWEPAIKQWRNFKYSAVLKWSIGH